MSEKMSVSRSAIAKWETNKGMPDVNNLKVIAQLLNVSVDDLLDDEEKISFHEMKEAIHLDDYEKTGKCRDQRDAVCFEKNKDAKSIVALIRRKKMTKVERIIDFISGSCYALDGNLQKISNYIFIATPNSVDISGDFQDLFGGGDNSFDIAGFKSPLL